MKVDHEQLMQDGFLILRQVVPPDELEGLRASYETLIERQGGRSWLATGAQPRLTIAPVIDESTANTAEIWLHENTLGASRQLLCVPEAAAVTWMGVMCSPLEDHGPANWHRDIHPIDMAPMHLLQLDMLENGPRYLQWNIPLYDDDVLWVVPGSHRRLNTEQENRQLLENNRAPLSSGVPVQLRAGDGVVYVNFLLHWGSNYSRKLRRTLHGGYCIFTADAALGCGRLLSPSARETFARFNTQTARMMDATESALRVVLNGDAGAYHSALDRLQPGIGEIGKLVLTIYLCKAAYFIRIMHRPDLEGVPEDLRRRAVGDHPISLNWGQSFAERFTSNESESLWQRFEQLDTKLQAKEEHFMPGYQSGPMRYYFEDLDEPFGVDEFITSWG